MGILCTIYKFIGFGFLICVHALVRAVMDVMDGWRIQQQVKKDEGTRKYGEGWG